MDRKLILTEPQSNVVWPTDINKFPAPQILVAQIFCGTLK